MRLGAALAQVAALIKAQTPLRPDSGPDSPRCPYPLVSVYTRSHTGSVTIPSDSGSWTASRAGR